AMMTQMLPALQAGRVKGLAYTGHTRQAVLPDLPLASETVPGYSAHVWFGLVAPRGTPAALSRAVSESLIALGKDPALSQAFHKAGMGFLPSSPEAFREKVTNELPDWQSTYRTLLA